MPCLHFTSSHLPIRPSLSAFLSECHPSKRKEKTTTKALGYAIWKSFSHSFIDPLIELTSVLKESAGKREKDGKTELDRETKNAKKSKEQGNKQG